MVSLETDCGTSKGAGTVVFDCIQLEEGNVANDYNILEDGSFELMDGIVPYKWKSESTTVSFVEKKDTEHVDGKYSYHIEGEPGKNKYLRFTTNLGSSKNGYVLSGWIQTNTTPIRSGRTLQVKAYHVEEDADGDEIEYTATCKLNAYSDGWKYFCLLLPAKEWKSTDFTISFNDNIGTLRIDGLQLTKNDVQTKSYNSDGQVSSKYTAIKSTSYTYDAYARLRTQTAPSGEKLTYNYAGNNDVTSVSSSVGPETYYTYDSYGNVLTSIVKDSAAGTHTQTRYYTETTYTENGNFPKSSTDATGVTTSYEYNELTGQLEKTTLPLRVILADAGDNEAVAWDPSIMEMENVIVDYGYDAEDRITSVTQGDRSVTYEYGEFDDLTGINHNGFSYNYSYDGFGNIQEVSLAGEVLCTYEYNPFNGSLIRSVLADGTTTGTVYDEYGRVTSSSMNDEVVNEYVYDNDGNVARKTDVIGNKTTAFDYNDSGLVVRTEVYSGNSTASKDLESRMQYTYTKGGLVGGLSYQEAGGDIKTYAYTYAGDELPTKSTHPDGSTTAWTYDALRRNTQTVFTPKSGAAAAKKLYTTYAYQKAGHVIDGTGRITTTGLVSTFTNKFGSSGSAVSQFDYTYDTWGNIVSIADLSGNKKAYTYNDYSEIVNASETYSDGSTVNYAYTYDAGGNILTETINGTVNRYVYDNVWKDKLVSYNGKAITYDKFGCPLNYMGATMTWDANGNLTSIKDGTDTITYTYLSGGQRSTKIVNGKKTEYHYNNGMLLSETTGDETLRYYYDSAGRVASIAYKKGTNAEVSYFFARNLHGDVIAVYRSSDSKLIGTYEYDLWGRPISVKEASAGIDTDGILQKNPIRYRSYYYDNETGFYNLNLRYYDPEIRRFISADSMDVLMVATTSINCKNLFNYCENNPVNGKDSSGAVIETPLDLVTLGISIVDVCKNPTDPWAWAGLAGDAIDLIPCVSFVGEAVKGARCAAKYGDDVGEVVVDGIRAIGKKLDDAVKSFKGSSKPKPIDIELKYKDGWTAAQKAEADAKVRALSEAKTVKTSVNRSGTSASSRYKSAYGNASVPTGYDVDHTIDLQLGGADDILNMNPLDMSVNRSLGVQIKNAIKDYPDGTVFGQFTIH